MSNCNTIVGVTMSHVKSRFEKMEISNIQFYVCLVLAWF